MPMTRKQFLMGVGPSILVNAGLLAVPLVTTLVWSFQKVAYGSAGQWIGLGNYTRLLSDPRFRAAVRFSVGFAVVDTCLLMVLGYGLALLMNRVRKARPVFLGLLLVPYVVPAIISATAFSWLFDDNFGGLVNYLLDYVGIHNIHWFTSTWPNRGLVLLEALWAGLPFYMLVFLSALQGVPTEQVEAAVMDGANWWQRQWHVVIPAIGPMFRFLALISISSTLGIFDALVALAPNAQVVGTQSVSLYIYLTAFARDQQQLGLGSAVSVLMLVVMLALVSPIVRRIYREVKAP
jgi:ABC-type sugar transport system permease subunit